MKKVAVLGSTGSVGKQTLDVINQFKNDFIITALVANKNKTLLREQKDFFNVEFAGLIDVSQTDNDCFYYGADTLIDAVDNADIIVVATKGIIALPAVIKALKNGKTVAIANKECVISAGELLLEARRKGNGILFPVDSEHSAIYQCLNGNQTPEKIILTCSGGAFLGKKTSELKKVNAEEALKHPKWNMGNKITIDSATLINKGFEVLEARWFFDIDPSKIEVIIHPQSIVHSMVEFCDGSILAQLGVTDMRLPIAYALNYPNRLPNSIAKLDLKKINDLQFFPVDEDVFKGISICRNAYYMHKLMPAVLVAADEIAVEYFLENEIKFYDIYKILEYVCDHYKHNLDAINFDVKSILLLDEDVKKYTKHLIEEKYVITR